VGELTGAYQFAGNMPTPTGTVRVPFSERDEISIRAELGAIRWAIFCVSEMVTCEMRLSHQLSSSALRQQQVLPFQLA
jgi:hypothetical protein